MQKSVDQLYNKIKDITSKEEFLKEIENKKLEFDNLLDEKLIALLIVDELGQNENSILKIKDIQPGYETSIIGKITNISEPKTFNRKNGSIGEVVNLEISDETSKCRLALWDKDVKLVKNNTLSIGTNVKVINGYVKQGFNGVEINIGRWGLIETIDENIPRIENHVDIIQGVIVEIQPSRAFFKDNGEFGFVTNIKIKTNEETKSLTLWDNKVKEIQKYKVGDKIKINNLTIKNNNGKDEIHLNGNGKINNL